MNHVIKISDIGKKDFKITACLGYSDTIVNIDGAMKELQKALPPSEEILDRFNNWQNKKYKDKDVFISLDDFEKIVREIKIKSSNKNKIEDIDRIAIRCYYNFPLFYIKPTHLYVKAEEYKPKEKSKPFKFSIPETGQEVHGGITKDTIDITRLQKTEAVECTNVPPPTPPTEEELKKAERLKKAHEIFDLLSFVAHKMRI